MHTPPLATPAHTPSNLNCINHARLGTLLPRGVAFAVATVLVAGVAPGQSVERIWQNNCMKCHGEDGQGGGAGTQTLLTRDLFDQAHDRRFFDIIKTGKADLGMEGFAGALEDKQVWGLVNYIRELQARALRRESGSISEKLDAQGLCTTQHASFAITTLIDDGLDTPWAVDWLPRADAQPPRMLVTNRSGTVHVFESSSATFGSPGTLSAPIANIPRSVEAGQGGMMDVAVHPDYATNANAWVYLAFTKPLRGNATMTTLVRGRLTRDGDRWTFADQQTIWEAKPEHAIASGLHFGVRIVFGPPLTDGPNQGKRHLYFSIGERGQANHAQDLTRPNGKIHRIFDDGTIPADNPFIANPDAYHSIWSFGHRNPQGLVLALDGSLWDTEHGPRGGDELNHIEKARNYGWPVVSFGINYPGTSFKTPWPDLEGQAAQDLNIKMPTDRWLPSIGACGLSVVQGGPWGESFPMWKGDLLAGGLSGENVDRIRLARDGDAYRVVEREEIVHGLGRVRDVEVAPDGSVVVVLNGPDKIIRLAPPSK